MTDRPTMSLPLEQVRVMLFPNLGADEGRDRVRAAIEGQADVETWRRIEAIATQEPDLFTYLFEALEDLRAERASEPALVFYLHGPADAE